MADKETEQIKKLNQTVHSKDTRERDQAYNEYVKQVTPTHNLIFHMVKAFFTGGIICCIGQFILNTCENYGLDKDTSGGWCSMLLILLSVILTGFNIYPSIANWGGAGALVPITGFANGVAAPAIVKILHPIPKTCPSLKLSHIRSQDRRSSFRKKGRFLESDVRFLRSPVL